MRNLRLDICYDGTRYKGWQRLQNSDQTIQGKLEQTLTRLLGESIEVSASGRTDAGTHALHQVANFHCISQMPCEDILDQLRELKVDLRSNPAVFIGGGSALFRDYLENSPLVASATFVDSVNANAIGYQAMAEGQLSLQRA